MNRPSVLGGLLDDSFGWWNGNLASSPSAISSTAGAIVVYTPLDSAAGVVIQPASDWDCEWNKKVHLMRSD